jgi:shikimate dehydrogenase
VIKAAVLGSPIKHSLSPVLHGRAYELLNIEADYSAIELTPEGADDFFRAALYEEWRGFSLTMPLKESIIEIGSVLEFEIDPVAKLMHSGNTVVRKDGNFFVTSTDRTGFIRLLQDVPKNRVAIIGGGGTARAALGALDGVSQSVDFLLRTPSRSKALLGIATTTELNFFGMEHSLEGYDLVITTVPAGASDELAEALDFRIPTLFEVLYNPYPTALLKKAQELGSRTFDGIDLLVEQALDQIHLFSARDFDYSEMRSELLMAARNTLE